jgi:hypothetical protein
MKFPPNPHEHLSDFEDHLLESTNQEYVATARDDKDGHAILDYSTTSWLGRQERRTHMSIPRITTLIIGFGTGFTQISIPLPSCTRQSTRSTRCSTLTLGTCKALMIKVSEVLFRHVLSLSYLTSWVLDMIGTGRFLLSSMLPTFGISGRM